MRSLAFKTGALAAGLFLVALQAHAVPLMPGRDDEVVEVLTATSGNRLAERELRKRLAARPSDARLALTVARQYLSQARSSGDPRFAGLALAALSPWPDPKTSPADVLLMRADLQQYLHDFDASVANLRLLLARPGTPSPHAWLVLATVLRVQGKYAESDQACRAVASVGAAMYSSACLAENESLRGNVAQARSTFATLLADPTLNDAGKGWLLTSMAELEERDGRVAQADALYRKVLALGPDSYASTAYADFLIAQHRPAEALKVLQNDTRTDAVLLRLAIAGVQANAPGAASDVAEMRDRINLANERPDARIFHGREQAMFALFVDRAPDRALALARGDVAQQREPLDLLVFAEAAKASGQREAIDAARKLKSDLGLHDRRIDAAL